RFIRFDRPPFDNGLLWQPVFYGEVSASHSTLAEEVLVCNHVTEAGDRMARLVYNWRQEITLTIG
ncbi:MAG: hypothetical protein ACRDAV_08445, partial [Plesiomonas shigelloides]